MDRLKIAIQEIQVARQVIDVSHGSFIKRTLARMIAMRMHNLIGDQIFYQTNNIVNAANQLARKALKGHSEHG